MNQNDDYTPNFKAQMVMRILAAGDCRISWDSAKYVCAL